MLHKRETPISKLRKTGSGHPYGMKVVWDEWRRSLHKDRRSLVEIPMPLLGELRAQSDSSGGVPIIMAR